MSSRTALALLAFVLTACGGSSLAPADAGQDAQVDAARAQDAGADAGPIPDCGTGSSLALGQCASRARYEADVRFVAAPREPGSTHWQAVQDLCRTRLTELGFDVELHDYGTGVNVIGTRLGTSEPDRRVLVGGHYDHIAGCAGADDNASGTADALEVARVLATASFPRTLVVACWDEEERGLVGARAHAMREAAASRSFDVVYVFETMAYADATPGAQTLPIGFEALFPRQSRALREAGYPGDFIAAIGDEGAHDALTYLSRHAFAVGLPIQPLEVPARLIDSPAIADLRRSDHAAFWEQGVPALFLTDTANFRYDGYHCGARPDVVENLDLDFATRVVAATTGATAESLGLP